MKKEIIGVAAVLGVLGALFIGAASASADCINDNILLEYARAGSGIMTKPTYRPRDEIRYLLVDVTSDGNNELVALDNYCEVFTVENGKVKMISQEPRGFSGGTGFISYYNDEYYIGYDCYQGGAYRYKSLGKYIDGEWSSLYKTMEYVDYNTYETTYLINDEAVSLDDYNNFLDTVIYGCQVPESDYKTLDELEEELQPELHPSYVGWDNDEALKDYAQNHLGAIRVNSLFRAAIYRKDMRYLLADVTGDGNSDLIIVDDSVHSGTVLTNNNGNIEQIYSDSFAYDSEHPYHWKSWVQYDDNYKMGYFGNRDEDEYNIFTLSQSGEKKKEVDIHTKDKYGSTKYYLDDEICTKEEYEKMKEYIYNEKAMFTIGDFATLDQLISGETPIKIFVNSDMIHSDSAPTIVDGRTLVPIRAVSEALGYDVEWEQEKQQITLSSDSTSKKVTMTIGDYSINSNNKKISIDVPAQIINDRTYIPVRAVAEALNCIVDWNGDERAVYIK